MNSQITSSYNMKPQTLEYQIMNLNSQKRGREEDKETPEQTLSNSSKKRQPKSLFRPWNNETVEEPLTETKTAPKKDISANNIKYQPKITLPSAPILISPYQLALQQQQRQTALALQQAMYQRQLVMAHVWAQQRQQQHHQMMLHHQQQMRQQQLFVFGQKPGPK